MAAKGATVVRAHAIGGAAKVGAGATGNPERPMDAMVAAVSDQGEVATCNAGFLRDDAVLVVTFVTDENDNAGDGSGGSPSQWRDALVQAKHGDPDAIVVLGLFGGMACGEASPVGGGSDRRGSATALTTRMRPPVGLR